MLFVLLDWRYSAEMTEILSTLNLQPFEAVAAVDLETFAEMFPTSHSTSLVIGLE